MNRHEFKPSPSQYDQCVAGFPFNFCGRSSTDKIHLISESDNEIRCDRCDATEYLGGEINERTLKDAGWYLGVSEVLCPEHSEQVDADFDFASTPHPRAYYEVDDEHGTSGKEVANSFIERLLEENLRLKREDRIIRLTSRLID